MHIIYFTRAKYSVFCFRIIKNVDFNGVTGRINFFGRNSRLSQVDNKHAISRNDR
jgi:hypothetical protein